MRLKSACVGFMADGCACEKSDADLLLCLVVLWKVSLLLCISHRGLCA